jgi:dTDP-4-dehydrorhamnose reductase
MVLDLLIDGEGGIRHLANPGALSWSDFARAAMRLGDYDPALVQEGASDAPLNTALTSERGVVLPPLESALERFFRDSEVDWGLLERAAVAAE